MRSKGQPVRPVPLAVSMRDEGPERWADDAGARDVASLDIPPHAHRERTFEVFCSLQVRYGGNEPGAWHGMRVLVNGAQEWTRRVDTDASGRDSLDYRFRRTVPVGEPLRVVVRTEVKLAVRVALSVTADEDG